MMYCKSITDATKRAAIEATLPLIFDAVDTNLDNAIEKEEFGAYFASLGIHDANLAGQVFRYMDSNNDGVLSKEGEFYFQIFFIFKLFIINQILKIEFSQFGNEFFLSKDSSSPSRFFFGPLV
jgi:hypothetical protein